MITEKTYKEIHDKVIHNKKLLGLLVESTPAHTSVVGENPNAKGLAQYLSVTQGMALTQIVHKVGCAKVLMGEIDSFTGMVPANIAMYVGVLLERNFPGIWEELEKEIRAPGSEASVKVEEIRNNPITALFLEFLNEKSKEDDPNVQMRDFIERTLNARKNRV